MTVAMVSEKAIPLQVTLSIAVIYVLSGVSQPLLMTVANDAGLADPSCQLYMAFYYSGPACLLIPLLLRSFGRNVSDDPNKTIYMSWSNFWKTAGIAFVDIVAQTMNYTGSVFAGPTIFAIIYSSVTVWCAILSRLMLNRYMTRWQWIGVLLVFAGLGIAGLNSVSLGPRVFHGAVLVIVGSCLHALMYVASEFVMNKAKTSADKRDRADISAQKYCAIYASIAFFGYFLWQVVYTAPHYDQLILHPMEVAHTTYLRALVVLLSIAGVSVIHSITFFHTVKHCPGGATSAGIMKGLQAVLVFVVTSLIFCGHTGGIEMCFTKEKLISLLVVVVGLIIYGKATERVKTQPQQQSEMSVPCQNHSGDDVETANEGSPLLEQK